MQGYGDFEQSVVEHLKDTASTDPVHRHNDSFKSLITTEQAEAYAQARVDEVLDMVADKASQKYLMPEFANAIRALKEQQS